MHKFKYTIPGQMLEFLKTHAVISLIFIVFWLIMVSLAETKFGSVIFAVLGVSAYAISVYNTACGCAIRDKRPSSRLKPHPAKGFILPAVLLGVNVIIIAVYKLSWAFGGDGTYLQNVWAVLGNLVSLIWTSPLDKVLGMAHGHIELTDYIIIFLLPVLSSAGGYFAGYKDIDVFGKIASIAYEKQRR